MRLSRTWQKFDTKVQALMLANIKADLNSRIMGCRCNVEVESSHSLNINDSEECAMELSEELDAKLAGHQLVWSLATKKLDEYQQKKISIVVPHQALQCQIALLALCASQCHDLSYMRFTIQSRIICNS